MNTWGHLSPYDQSHRTNQSEPLTISPEEINTARNASDAENRALKLRIEAHTSKIAKYTLESDPHTRNKKLIDEFLLANFPNEQDKVVPDYAGNIYTPESWKPSHETFSHTYDNRAYRFKMKQAEREILDLSSYMDYIKGERVPAGTMFSEADNEENSVIPNDCNDIIRALNAIILRHSRLKHGNSLIHEKGNTIFLRTNGIELKNPVDYDGLDVGYGLELLKGFHASVRPGSQRCLINVSKATNVFYKGQKIELGISLYRENSQVTTDSPFREFERKSIKQFLEGKFIKVEAADKEFTRRFVEISEDDANSSQLIDQDRSNQSVSVANFYRYRNCSLRYPKKQLVALSAGPKAPNITVPLEFCSVEPGQRFSGRLNANGSANMIRAASVAPDIYKELLEKEFLDTFGLQGATNATLQAFGLGFDPGLLKVQAFRFNPPRIIFDGGKVAPVRPDQGSWMLQNGTTLRSTGTVSEYMILSINQREEVKPETVVRDLLEQCKGLGIKKQSASSPYHPQVFEIKPNHTAKNRDEDLVSQITVLFKNKIGPEANRLEALKIAAEKAKTGGENDSSFSVMVFCLLPSTSPKIYNAIKRGGDVIAGVHTVCMSMQKIHTKRNNTNQLNQYYQNVALKVNLKLGGINHSIESDAVLNKIFPNYINRPVMLLGADVSHSGRRDLPSITAVVGSVDPSQSQVYSTIDFQKNGEMIENIGNAVRERIRAYSIKHKKLPSSIVMFRDGVSESQYKQVLEQEVAAIDIALVDYVNYLRGQEAMKHHGPFEKPRLTVLVVGKRHQTRFFPSGVENNTRKGANTLPGLVVDRAVTAVSFPVRTSFGALTK
ncbi:hypothetical protein H072_8265 [Dactylellina haptotyla CBS 200.50]|uniref:Piwi domain-containing protein n=1 Tax=Dactylellina haptotyla (strain CBS 200.50) TaxID=1284197 RepID=S8AA72_DACHA|nr:hypothetical protein H072_8265 [Dactylellina haptotyla CBS 200.50]